jgi:flagellar assembly protein FliH
VIREEPASEEAGRFEWVEISQLPEEWEADVGGFQVVFPCDHDAEGDGYAVEPAPEDRARVAVEQARAEAERLLAEAEQEAVAIREQARLEGAKVGEAQGRKLLEEATERVESLSSELAEHKSSLYREARAQVVELVLALAQKVLGGLAESQAEAVLRVAERAIQLLSDRETLTIRVHPEEVKLLVEAKPKILETFDGIQKLTVVKDPSVKRGGCLVQTPTTEIDARLDTQLQEIVRSVRAC